MPNSDSDFFVPEDVDTLIMRNQDIKITRDQLFFRLGAQPTKDANWSDFDACSEEIIPTILGVCMMRSDCLKLARHLGSRLLIIDAARKHVFDPDETEWLGYSLVEDLATQHGLFDLRAPKRKKQNSQYRYSDSAA